MDNKQKYIFSTIALVFITIASVVATFPDNKLHLVFCDVGQGDATLAIKGSTQILIDGGPSDKVLACLSEHVPFWDRKIEMVVVTHPDYDHLTGIVSVIDRYVVKQIVSNSLVLDTGVFGTFREEVIAIKIPVYSPKYGDKIRIGGLELKILYPEEKLGNEIVWTGGTGKESSGVMGTEVFAGNTNATSIVSELVYGNFKAILAGDSGFDQETIMENNNELEKVNVIKIAHHGSKYSTSTEFLDLIRPDLAVISVGLKNTYGHPATETLTRLKEVGINIKRTDLDGEVEVVSDGKGWVVKK